MPCAFSRLGQFDDNATSFQCGNDLLGIEEDNAIVTRVNFLLDPRLSEATERDKITHNRCWFVFLSFASERAEKLVQLVATDFCGMGLTFAHHPSRLKAVLSLEIKFTAGFVNIETQIIIPQSEE